MIVVFGSINIDMVMAVPALPRPGETVLAPGYRLVPGGKGANQALAAARAGAPVAMAGSVGRDEFADLALAELRRDRVDLSAVTAVEAATGCAVVCVDPAGENQIVVASGANLAARADQLPDALLGPRTTLLLQNEVDDAANAALVARARSLGTRIVLNAAPVRPVARETLDALEYLVVNRVEAEAIAGGADDIETAACRLARAHGLTVVVTLGDDGAMAVTAESGWRIAALPISPVDTTGAGDAFVGVFAAAIDGGADRPEALRRAAVAGALACLVPGAQPGLPRRSEIEARAADLAPATPL